MYTNMAAKRNYTLIWQQNENVTSGRERATSGESSLLASSKVRKEGDLYGLITILDQVITLLFVC